MATIGSRIDVSKTHRLVPVSPDYAAHSMCARRKVLAEKLIPPGPGARQRRLPKGRFTDYSPVSQSRPRSNEGAAWVSAPTLIRSTPVRAIAAIVFKVTPPEASSSTVGA